MDTHAKTLKKLIEVIVVATVVGGALAFGGVQPLAYTIIEGAIFAALLLLLLDQTRRGEIRLHFPLWPALFALWVVLQLVPLPASLVLQVAPGRFFDIGSSDPVLGEVAWTTLSIYPHATLVALFKLLAYVCAFLLVAHVFDTRERKSFLIKALIFIGAFEAAYGIVQYLTGWQKIFTFQKLYNLRQATGTYINYNHFAGLLELTIPFVLASAFYSIQVPAQHHSAREGRGVVGRHHPRRYQAFFYLFLLMIMVVAVFFSHSRMGILATLFSVIAISLLAHLRATGKVWLGMIVVFLLGALGYGLWIGIGPVLTRFESLAEPSALQAAGRLSIWRDGLRLIQDYPVTGSGLGTFGIAFRRFQTTMVNAHVDHAHNDYLELTADTGLVGVALLFLPVLFLLIKMIASFLHDSSHYRRAVTLGCIGSVLSILIHSTMDFNLQIPANALTFAVVLGIGYKAGCLESAPKSLAPPSPPAATYPWPG